LPSVCKGALLTNAPTEKDTNAYRAELQGFHAMLMAIEAVCSTQAVTSGSVTLAMDNETAVSQSQYTDLAVPTTSNHNDLIRAIRRTISGLPITVHIEWVKGHQDTGLLQRPLSIMALMNIDADELAKAFLTRALERPLDYPRPPPDLHREAIRIFVQDQKIIRSAAPICAQAVYFRAMREHLHSKGKMDLEAFELVDWEATGMAMSDSPPLFRLWAAKHASGQCAVGRYMHRWKFWGTDNCPLCNHPNETTRHVVQCPSSSATVAREEGLLQLADRLRALETHPEITECILQTFAHPTHGFSYHSSPWTALAAAEQDTIGFMATTEGRLAKSWASLQREHLQEMRSRRTARRWAACATQAILEWTHHIWTSRCSLVKKREREDEYATRRHTLAAAIDELKTTDPNPLLAEDRHLLSEDSICKLNRWNIFDKETWVQALRWAIESAEENQGNTNLQARTTLQSWLSGETL
jgi:hypothetical protein